MTKLTFRLDTVAFQEHVLNSPFMVEEMRARADRAKDLFEAIAPVGDRADGDDTPGTFKASGEVSSGTHGGVKKDRAWGRFGSNDPRALSKEFGHVAADGSFVEGSHAIVRAMDAMGGHGSASVGQFHGVGTARRKKFAQKLKRRAASAAKRAAETPAQRHERLTKAAQKRTLKKLRAEGIEPQDLG